MATRRRTSERLAASSKPIAAPSDWRAQMAARAAQTAPRLDISIEQRAACAGEDTTLFFPHETDVAAVEHAKAMCTRCPVIGDCLMQALRNRDEFAILGGTTPAERRLIRRRLAERSRGTGVAA
ncbi:WhiB family transcriptional regulator [Streptomyces sp. PKU-EA00015]|uniref:WhiB family transcriptional regulator n=1 Tax=Streptomyces sp. PKU-EA00015 TaxID=2748326 RepID=UPI00210C658E|nr:WhiB family transcriptional regulator [Streptomyces sp. PKU-EA00015]